MVQGMNFKGNIVANLTHENVLNEDLTLKERHKNIHTAIPALFSAGLLTAGASAVGVVGAPVLGVGAGGVALGTIIHAGGNWWHRKKGRLYPDEISAILKYIDHIIYEEPLNPEKTVFDENELTKIRNAVLTILKEHGLYGTDLPKWMQKLLNGRITGAQYLATHAEDRREENIPPPEHSRHFSRAITRKVLDEPMDDAPIDPDTDPASSSLGITRQGLRWGGGKKSLKKRKYNKKRNSSKRRRTLKKKKTSKRRKKTIKRK